MRVRVRFLKRQYRIHTLPMTMQQANVKASDIGVDHRIESPFFLQDDNSESP